MDVNKLHQELLCDACINGNLPRVKELLDLGVNPNEMYGESTHLMYASMWGSVDVVEELINRGVDLDTKCGRGYTALMTTSWEMDELECYVNGQMEAAKLLILNGCDVDISVGGHTFLEKLPTPNRIKMQEYIDSLFAPKPAKK